VHLQYRLVGLIYAQGKHQQQRLEEAFHPVEYLAIFPDVLATILQAIGDRVASEACRSLDRYPRQEG